MRPLATCLCSWGCFFFEVPSMIQYLNLSLSQGRYRCSSLSSGNLWAILTCFWSPCCLSMSPLLFSRCPRGDRHQAACGGRVQTCVCGVSSHTAKQGRGGASGLADASPTRLRVVCSRFLREFPRNDRGFGRTLSLRGFGDACRAASEPEGRTLVPGGVSRWLRHRWTPPDPLPAPLPLRPQRRAVLVIVTKTTTERWPS